MWHKGLPGSSTALGRTTFGACPPAPPHEEVPAVWAGLGLARGRKRFGVGRPYRWLSAGLDVLPRLPLYPNAIPTASAVFLYCAPQTYLVRQTDVTQSNQHQNPSVRMPVASLSIDGGFVQSALSTFAHVKVCGAWQFKALLISIGSGKLLTT